MDNTLSNIKLKKTGLNEKRLSTEKNHILQIEINQNTLKIISNDNKSKNNTYVTRQESLTVDAMTSLQEKNNY
jgi:hypothetical protein